MKKNCVVCGVEFEARRKIDLTCGQKCSYQNRLLRMHNKNNIVAIEKTCKHCGLIFVPIFKLSRVSGVKVYSNIAFCSKVCQSEHHKESAKKRYVKVLTRKKYTRSKDLCITEVEKICKICDTVFKDKSPRKNMAYCSIKCKNKSYNTKKPTWKGGIKTIECLICGKIIEIKHQGHIPKFCSDECQRKNKYNTTPVEKIKDWSKKSREKFKIKLEEEPELKCAHQSRVNASARKSKESNPEKTKENMTLYHKFGTQDKTKIDPKSLTMISIEQAYKRNNLNEDVLNKITKGETRYAYAKRD